mmetsp:Transcript_758/g.2029  ORF Transcript_758/g.2029 Transcript_758/m.2029 type:complete len:262 (-) Transcript_758:160-945(-)
MYTTACSYAPSVARSSTDCTIRDGWSLPAASAFSAGVTTFQTDFTANRSFELLCKSARATMSVSNASKAAPVPMTRAVLKPFRTLCRIGGGISRTSFDLSIYLMAGVWTTGISTMNGPSIKTQSKNTNIQPRMTSACKKLPNQFSSGDIIKDRCRAFFLSSLTSSSCSDCFGTFVHAPFVETVSSAPLDTDLCDSSNQFLTAGFLLEADCGKRFARWESNHALTGIASSTHSPELKTASSLSVNLLSPPLFSNDLRERLLP